MSNLRITEFSGMTSGHKSDTPVPACPPVAEQAPLAIAGASAPSAAFNASTRLIRVTAEAICAVFVGGTGPVAVAGTSIRLAAGQSMDFGVSPADKLAVISDT